MKNKVFITGLALSLICTTVYSQHNFDSIKICHAKGGELRGITIGEYKVKIQNGELSTFSSKDDAITYEAENKLFIIKNLDKGSSLKLQLSNEGVIVNAKDTSIIMNSPHSVNLTTSNGNNEVLALYSVNDFSFALEFKNDRVSKISFPTTGKFIVINLIQVQGVYKWDFAIESAEHLNRLILTYVFDEPYLLSIQDDKNKVGIRLIAKGKNGLFSELVGQRIYGNNSFASDNSYKLQYGNHGRLKKQGSKFNLSCEY
jgi:hypothetical protein